MPLPIIEGGVLASPTRIRVADRLHRHQGAAAGDLGPARRAGAGLADGSELVSVFSGQLPEQQPGGGDQPEQRAGPARGDLAYPLCAGSHGSNENRAPRQLPRYRSPPADIGSDSLVVPSATPFTVDYLMDVGTMLSDEHFSEAKQHAMIRKADFNKVIANQPA
jgi:hypothetical protein